jgi:C4-dicarboxylate transporter DctM subunit
MTAMLFLSFTAFLLIGMPIAVSLLISSTLTIISFTNLPLLVIMQKVFTAIDSYNLMAIPFFMICGGLLEKGGVSKRLVDLANSLVGSLPGGLPIVTFLASCFFGAISGSSAATVAAIGSIMVPAMLADGYPLKFALATAASAGWLGIIIPPSIPMVVYGLSGNVSVGELFIGGIVPGFMLAAGMSLYAYIYGKKYITVTRSFSIIATWDCFKKASWALLMPLIILGGIYCGIFTPTEAAAVASFYGLIIGIFIYRELNLRIIYDVLKSSVITSGMIMFAIASASAFGYLLTRELVPVKVANFIMGISNNTTSFMALITILLLIVGTFMDTLPAIMILTPIIMPSLHNYGISPVAFGIIMIINLGIGQCTPPVGLCLYVAASLQRTKIENVVCKHLVCYMFLAVLVLIVIMLFPWIILFLPKFMH